MVRRVVDSSATSSGSTCRSGHMTGLHTVGSEILFSHPACRQLQPGSGPLKTLPCRRSILTCQTLEANCRQSQLLPTSSVAAFDTFASRKAAAGSSRLLLTAPGVFSHLRLITELLMKLVTSGLTNGFERRARPGSGLADGSRSLRVLHPGASDVARPRRGLTAPPDEKAGLNQLFVMSRSII